MQSVDIPTLREALTEGAVILDTRPAAQVALDGIPGARPVSVEDIRAGRLPELPKDAPVYLVCERGQISELAGFYLEAAGFSQVFNLAGGMKAWRQAQAGPDESD